MLKKMARKVGAIVMILMICCHIAMAETTIPSNDINGEYGENIIVCLRDDVIIPEKDPKCYNAQETAFSESRCIAAYGNEYTRLNDGTCEWKLDNQKYVLYPDGYFMVTSDLAESYQTIVGYTIDGDDSILPEYIESSELSFASTDEAYSMAMNAIETLPLPEEFGQYSACIDIVPFSYETITMVIDEVSANDWWLKPSHEERSRALTKDDEFYLVDVSFILDDVPLTTVQYGLTNERYVYGSRIRMYINRDGIAWLSVVGNLYTPIDYLPTDSLLQPLELMKELGSFFDEIIMNRPMLITDIKLEYVPIPMDRASTYQLKPVWLIMLIEEGSDMGVWLMVDAITGQFLNL